MNVILSTLRVLKCLAFFCACMCSCTPVSTSGRPLACQMKDRHEQCTQDERENYQPEQHDNRRVIAIGDVHGSYTGLLDLLYNANITVSRDQCNWREQGDKSDQGVILVQVGDIVDRGPQAWEAFACLRSLQKQAPLYNSKVVRLIGSKLFHSHIN